MAGWIFSRSVDTTIDDIEDDNEFLLLPLDSEQQSRMATLVRLLTVHPDRSSVSTTTTITRRWTTPPPLSLVHDRGDVSSDCRSLCQSSQCQSQCHASYHSTLLSSTWIECQDHGPDRYKSWIVVSLLLLPTPTTTTHYCQGMSLLSQTDQQSIEQSI